MASAHLTIASVVLCQVLGALPLQPAALVLAALSAAQSAAWVGPMATTEPALSVHSTCIEKSFHASQTPTDAR